MLTKTQLSKVLIQMGITIWIIPELMMKPLITYLTKMKHKIL